MYSSENMMLVLLTISLMSLYNTDYEIGTCVNFDGMNTTIYKGDHNQVGYPMCEYPYADYHTHPGGKAYRKVDDYNYASDADLHKWIRESATTFIIQYSTYQYVEYVKIV